MGGAIRQRIQAGDGFPRAQSTQTGFTGQTSLTCSSSRLGTVSFLYSTAGAVLSEGAAIECSTQAEKPRIPKTRTRQDRPYDVCAGSKTLCLRVVLCCA